MQIIADSGSTKCTWTIYGNSIIQVETIGFNPFFVTKNDLKEQIETYLSPHISENVDRIIFYGSGCQSDENQLFIQTSIQAVFPNSEILVYSDLLGACHAVCGNENGFAAILGTGTNSCFYDGKHILKNANSLGYILGDEGSGAYIGKQLISAYLNQRLDKEIHQAFDHTFQFTYEHIINKIYRDRFPNRFLASFCYFINQHIENEQMYSLVKKSFNDFVIIQLSQYKQIREFPIGFVGSVAFHFSAILEDVLKDHQITLSKIIQNPSMDLLDYHKNKSI